MKLRKRSVSASLIPGVPSTQSVKAIFPPGFTSRAASAISSGFSTT